MAINAYLSMIILNVSGLKAPIKRYKDADWMKKKNKTENNQEHIICYL